MPDFDTFSHQADIGVRGFGATPEEAFVNGAKAMFSLMVDPKEVSPKNLVKIAVQAEDQPSLFVEWLNQLLATADIKRWLFSKFEMTIENGKSLQGKAWGEPITSKKHTLLTEVKAATYSQLKVEEKPDGQWVAQCIVDV
ncbi:MAG: archease [bacterium]|nr:archease [bacterium]